MKNSPATSKNTRFYKIYQNIHPLRGSGTHMFQSSFDALEACMTHESQNIPK